MAVPGVDFERALIGAICSPVDSPVEVVVSAVKSGVSADWFADGKWRLAWSACASLWRRNSTVAFDANLLLAEAKRLAAVNPDGFDGASLSVADIADAIDAAPGGAACAAGYIVQLKGEMILRSMRRAIESTFKAAGKTDPEFACEGLVTRLLEILSRTTVARTVPFGDLVDDALAKMRDAHSIYMVERRHDYVPGIPLPWWALTKLYNGFEPGFHIIGARTSVGKTSFALQLVRFFCERGLQVGFDSLDMNTRSFVGRFVSEMSRVSLFKASFGHTGEKDMAALETAGEKLRGWPLSVMVEYDVDHLFNWCRVRKSAGMLDVLFIDFVQLLSYPGSDRATDTGRMTRVSKTIKRIVNELDIPVVGLSQLNRDCEKDGGREPNKADLRESGALEQDATTVALLYHDKAVLDSFTAGARSGVGAIMKLACGQRHMADRIKPTFLKLDKNQNGGLGKLPFVVYSNYFTWMLGDYQAQPGDRTVGTGATQRHEPDYTPWFSRVHGDWRKSGIETELIRQGVYLDEDKPPVDMAAAPTQADLSMPKQPAPLPALEQLPPWGAYWADDDDDETDYNDPADELATLGY